MNLIGNGLRIRYGGAIAVDSVDVEVRPGRVTCVFGANGAGKSSLLRALAGLVPVQAGEVRYKDKVITKLPAHQRSRMGIALVPEGRALFTDLSVEDNLLLGGYTLSAKARRSAVTAAYDLFPNIAVRKNQAAGTLSGGQQQMLAVARGLVGKPTILMVDEPSLGLAPIIVNEILMHLRKLADEGLGVLLVEQNASRALTIADDALVLHRGRVEIAGPALDIKQSEVASAYLGLAGSLE